jgi:hypothetical protein
MSKRENDDDRNGGFDLDILELDDLLLTLVIAPASDGCQQNVQGLKTERHGRRLKSLGFRGRQVKSSG